MNRRGISDVVTLVLIILLVVAAVAAIGAFVYSEQSLVAVEFSTPVRLCSMTLLDTAGELKDFGVMKGSWEACSALRERCTEQPECSWNRTTLKPADAQSFEIGECVCREGGRG